MIHSEDLAELADIVDNLRCGLDIPMSPEFHIEQMKVELEVLSKDLKELYIKETVELKIEL